MSSAYSGGSSSSADICISILPAARCYTGSSHCPYSFSAAGTLLTYARFFTMPIDFRARNCFEATGRPLRWQSGSAAVRHRYAVLPGGRPREAEAMRAASVAAALRVASVAAPAVLRYHQLLLARRPCDQWSVCRRFCARLMSSHLARTCWRDSLSERAFGPPV